MPLYNLCSLTRLAILGKRGVHPLHLTCKRKNQFFKIVKKTTGYTNTVLSHNAIKKLLQNCKSVNEQFDTFLSYVQLPEQDVSHRILICKDIENALRTIFPESSLYIVGSSVSGIGLRGCDLDLSFHYEINPTDSQRSIIVTNVDVSSGKVPASDFPYLPIKQQLIFIQKVLEGSGITEATTVLPGRFPILNFSCNGLGCDLSINNRAALYGTRLMQYCSKLDHRVAPLFQLIAYWGKHSKLIGGPLKFKSYAVFLMIVYFLQKRHPPILPSIQNVLHKIVDEKNGNTSSLEINENMTDFSPSFNSENLEVLLREFFFFYANFDFTSVICTLDKNVWDGKNFLVKEPSFEMNTINVQDPFSLNWNVTTGVDWKHSKLLIKYLLAACQSYHESSTEPIDDRNWGLLAILDTSPKDYLFTKKETVEIEIPLRNIEKKSDGINAICDNVFSVFEECLLFQCYSIDSKIIKSHIYKTAPINKSMIYQKKYEKFRTCDQKEKTIADIAKNILFSRSMYVEVSETWNGRSNYFEHVENVEVFFNIEQNISRQVLGEKVGDKEKFIFLCECCVISTNDNVLLKIIMKPVNRNVFIPKLGVLLKEYFLKYSKLL